MKNKFTGIKLFAVEPVEVGWKEEGPPLPLVGLQHYHTCFKVVIEILILDMILILILVVIEKW